MITDGLAACFQLRVQLGDGAVVGARSSDEHRLARQIVHRGNRRRSRSGDHHLAHVGARRLGKGGNRFQLGPDRHHRRDHVDLALQEGRSQQIARHRHDHHVDLEVARLEVRIQIGLEQLERLVRQPALLPPVDEVVRAVERHADANRAALDDLVEVSGERQVRLEPHALPGGHRAARRCRDGRVGRGGTGGSRCRRCRRSRSVGGRRRRLRTTACRDGRQHQQPDNTAIRARLPEGSFHSCVPSVRSRAETSTRRTPEIAGESGRSPQGLGIRAVAVVGPGLRALPTAYRGRSFMNPEKDHE